MRTNSYVTLFRFDSNVGEYFSLGSFPAWVHSQARTRAEKGGTYSRNVFDVRIPGNALSEVLTDDLICFEKTDSTYPDLALCNRIAAVTHNRTGSFPHWHIEAENQYR